MAKKSRKAGARKLPKRIAGVKVPKELREPGGRLLTAISNPVLIDAAAAALIAAAARLRASAGPAQPAASPRAADLGAILSSLAIEGLCRFGESQAPAAGKSVSGAGVANGKAPRPDG